MDLYELPLSLVDVSIASILEREMDAPDVGASVSVSMSLSPPPQLFPFVFLRVSRLSSSTLYR